MTNAVNTDSPTPDIRPRTLAEKVWDKHLVAKGENGTCNGDSGGPIFYEDPTLGRIQVSLVSGGDAPCRATNTGPGFSRQEAFDFINCGTVEGDVSAVVACVDGLFGS